MPFSVGFLQRDVFQCGTNFYLCHPLADFYGFFPMVFFKIFAEPFFQFLMGLFTSSVFRHPFYGGSFFLFSAFLIGQFLVIFKRNF